jgi:hypothetical protein
MRKRRGDSPWSKLNVEQRKLMDKWYFDENLPYPEILERATKEFGVQASRQTLTAYFRHREDVVGGLAKWEDIDTGNPQSRRVGAGMDLKDLESRTLQSAAMAAYELSLAEPDKMRVTEMRSLMKMLSEHKRLSLHHDKEIEQGMLTQLKVFKGLSGLQTKEQFEEMVMQTAGILQRAQVKAAGHRAAAEQHKPADSRQIKADCAQKDGAAASISKDKQG